MNVRIGDAPIRVSRESAQWCAETIEKLWEQRHARIAESERADARKAYDEALRQFRSIAAEAAAR